MSQAVLFTFPSLFLSFLLQTQQVIDYPEPLSSRDGPKFMIYARFPYASIVGECNPSFLEQKTHDEFSSFLKDPNNYTLYRKTIDYPVVQQLVPDFNPVHDRYYLLSETQYSHIQNVMQQYQS